MTSRDALDLAWRWLPRGTRIGHCGTLDPLATGVLVVCAGTATRLAEYVQRMEKVYRAVIHFGVRSSTDDGEGTMTVAAEGAMPSLELLTRMLEEFEGTTDQVPPDHSAAKVTGRRAYALVRQGQQVTLAPRPVTIHAIRLLSFSYPRLELEIRCGKGTYIRALARDLGDRLGCGAYLAELRRTRIGNFREDAALSLDADQTTALARLLPQEEAVRQLPLLVMSEDQLVRLQMGQKVAVPDGIADDEEVAIFSAGGKLFAVAQVDVATGMIEPRKVFV